LTRILSALVLLPLVVGIVWYGPPAAVLALIGFVALLAFVEYAGLARRASEGFPAVVSGAATLATLTAVALGLPLELVLAPALLVTGFATIARGRPGEDALRCAAATLFPACYLGLPLGLAVALRAEWSAAVLLLPFLTIVVSDSCQYYGGRLLGRTPLAPEISPKKTVEGAVAGIVAAGVFTPLAGRYVLPEANWLPLVVLGVLLAGAGIAGDLFESLLKRSSGVKDSSGLIPGHGGMLDRIDALLFACPAYYVFLVSAGW
jgi:phosphatidate cytidylyltransferase